MRLPDDTLPLLTQGYAFLSNRRRAEGRDVVTFRLLGKRALGVCGPEWTRMLYDERLIARSSALPRPVRRTLVGEGAVHTLDGAAHRQRKQLFLRSLDPAGASALTRAVLEAWQQAEGRWARTGRMVVFRDAPLPLAEGVWRWCGLPGADLAAAAQDMVAMVDGFGAVGPRHVRGRRARDRQEEQLSRLVEDVRRGLREAPAGSVLDAASTFRDADGALLTPRVAAVELLNLVRPTVATTWFLAFAAHALRRHPELRDGLVSEDPVLVSWFAQEVRRFYPFTPFIGGTAVTVADWGGVSSRPGDLVLLDVYGQHHHPDLWPRPYRFEPSRFEGRALDPFTFVPQGGGDVETGHRCPGEPSVLLILEALLPRLARLCSDIPRQDDSIRLSRVPARPASGMVLEVR